MTDLQQGVSGSTTSSGASLVAISGNPTIGSGTRTVTTAGTRVQLSLVSIPCKKLTIQSAGSNTDKIFIGDSTVASSNGVYIFPTNSYFLTPSNLNLVYIDSAVNGEGVVYFYEN